jgi:hypothetical protein
MPKDTPGVDRTPRERGVGAKDGNEATLAGYVSSLFYVLSIPGIVLLTYVGYWQGYYEYSMVLPVFAGLFLTAVVGAGVVLYLRS